ncbi:MAG TPA: hypothetical protein VFT95_10260 [Micromonosporaceae bacterium]|nr:hypothetical protein [Micromonosporaceae bacterium]
MPDYFSGFDISRDRLDIQVDDLLNGLEFDIDRSPVFNEDDPGTRGTTKISPKITDGCTRTCGGCSIEAAGGTCTCECLPGGLGTDLGLTGW